MKSFIILLAVISVIFLPTISNAENVNVNKFLNDQYWTNFDWNDFTHSQLFKSYKWDRSTPDDLIKMNTPNKKYSDLKKTRYDNMRILDNYHSTAKLDNFDVSLTYQEDDSGRKLVRVDFAKSNNKAPTTNDYCRTKFGNNYWAVDDSVRFSETLLFDWKSDLWQKGNTLITCFYDQPIIKILFEDYSKAQVRKPEIILRCQYKTDEPETTHDNIFIIKNRSGIQDVRDDSYGLTYYKSVLTDTKIILTKSENEKDFYAKYLIDRITGKLTGMIKLPKDNVKTNVRGTCDKIDKIVNKF